MDELKNVSSEDLIQELTHRNVLEKIEVGLYGHFDLTPKYGTKAKYDGVYLLHKGEQANGQRLVD